MYIYIYIYIYIIYNIYFRNKGARNKILQAVVWKGDPSTKKKLIELTLTFV